MLLDVRIFSVHRTVKGFLCMRPPHVRTLSPLFLDRLPSFPSHSSGLHTESSNICTIECNVPSGELVAKSPFVMVRLGGIYWGRVRSGSGRGWYGRFCNIPVDITSETFRSE